MQVKHVLIVGPDGSGKSSLAQHLTTEHKMRYHHEGVPPPEAYKIVSPGVVSTLEYYKKQAYEQMRQGSTVFDRGIHCDLVYSTILRANPTCDSEDVEDFCRWFRKQGGIVVLMFPDFKICRERWLARASKGKELIPLEKSEQFRQIYHGYANLKFHIRHPYDIIVTENWDSPVGGFPCQSLCADRMAIKI